MSPAVFATARSWKRFHQRIGEVSQRYGTHDQKAWQSWFEKLGVDFRRESLVVASWSTPSVSDQIETKPPMVVGRTAEVQVDIHIASIGLASIGFHSLGLVVDRSRVDAVEIQLGTRAPKVARVDRSSPLVDNRDS